MAENARVGEVLLVEDNPDDRELARLALEQSGGSYRMTAVRDGAEAIEYLERTAIAPKELPRLVLLDLNLPKLNGVEVLTRMRERPALRFLPVVVLTTSSQNVDLERAYKAGANSYVVKPVDFEQFITSLAHVCRYWLELNEPAG